MPPSSRPRLRYLGGLLMRALIIICAVTAKGIARSLRQVLVSSIALAVLATVFGATLTSQLQLETGPVVVHIPAAVFPLTLCLPDGSTPASSDVESS
jgi:ABC-type Mn2+/Zn2+ transport system permease subunit